MTETGERDPFVRALLEVPQGPPREIWQEALVRALAEPFAEGPFDTLDAFDDDHTGPFDAAPPSAWHGHDDLASTADDDDDSDDHPSWTDQDDDL